MRDQPPGRTIFRRPGFWFGYVVFLLVLLELALRLGGFLFLLPRQLAQRSRRLSGSEFRILAIGESTTFGLGVRREMAYPEQLERLLNTTADTNFVVFNTGVPAQTSTSVLRNIDYQLLKYKPRVVISMLGVNDTNEALNDLSSRILFGVYVPEFVAGMRTYRLACVIRDYVIYAPAVRRDGAWISLDRGQRRPDGASLHNPFYFRQLELNYKDIIAKIESYRASVVILSYLRARASLQGLLAKIAEERAVPYIDLHAAETDTPALLTKDRFHPNENGHRIIAEKILRGLKQNGLLPGTADAP